MEAGVDTHDALRELLRRQREAWRAQPPGYARRMDDLACLRAQLKTHLDDFIRAIDADFGRRPRHETLFGEAFTVLHAIDHARRHLKRWMRPQRVAADWPFLPARCEILVRPLGVIGIIAPWNYPMNLALGPLVDALAAGNHAMLKPSEFTPRTAELLERMIGGIFPRERVAVVRGDADVAAAFSALPFDHLLFTGSTEVGAKVMAAAAPNLVPVTLELGGKSPAIVAPGFPVATAAARIATGKWFNAGQTCIAPDYVLLHAGDRDAFVACMREEVARRYAAPRDSPDYASIVNRNHYERLCAWRDEACARGAEVIALPDSGAADVARRIFPPTLVLGANDSMRLLREEIFGPILPVVTYRDIEEAIEYVNARSRPLALYLFDRDVARAERILAACPAGGACLDDCLLHFAQMRLPFGGIGASGMGAYHGHAGFLAFSHRMPVFRQSRLGLSGLLQPPYGKLADRLLQLLTR